MRLDARMAALAATVLAALSADSAHAVVAQSDISAPADPHLTLFDGDALPAATVEVAGTSDGTTGDVVDISCFHDGSRVDLAPDVPLAADGSFQTPVPAAALTFNTCRLKAIPDSSNAVGLHRFSGPRIAVSDYRVSGRVTGGPNDGLVYDYAVTANGLGGYWQLASLSAAGLGGGSPYALPTFDDEAGSWNDGALVDAFDQDSLRAKIVADGDNAFGPTAAANLFVGASDNPGLQPTVFSATQDAQTGDVTVIETAVLVKCPSNQIPPDAISCPSFQPTGLSWQRTHSVTESGRQDVIVDRLVSTDGHLHSVDLLISNDFDESETGWRFPPHAPEPSRFSRGDLTTDSEMPGAPFTLVADEADDEPGDSLEAGFAGLTFGTKPKELRWVFEDRFEARYELVVPSEGSGAELRHAYSQAFTLPDVVALGRRAELAWSPPAPPGGGPAGGPAPRKSAKKCKKKKKTNKRQGARSAAKRHCKKKRR